MLMRSPLQGITRHPLRAPRLPSLTQLAIAILRKFGSNAHVYTPGSTQVSYGVELVTTQFTSLAGYANQTGCTVAIVGDEVEVTATQTGVCFVDTSAVSISNATPYLVSAMARYSGSAGGLVYLGAAMASVPYSSSTTSATSVPLTLTPTSDNALVRLRLRIDASAIGQKAYFKLGSVRKQITTSSVTAGLLTSNYSANDGSTGLSAIDGTAGLVLDAAGATVQYNPATVPTGSYDGTGASTVVRTGASLTFTSAPSGDGIRLTPIYGASDTFSYVKFTASGSGSLIVFAGGSPVTFTLTGTPTQYQCGTSGNSSAWLIFRSNSAGMSASITINEISGSSGIHATQSTAGNRPVVRRGIYNLLTYSNSFSNAAWTKSNASITATGIDDPFGGTSAVTLTCSVGGGGMYQTIASFTGRNALWIRRRTGTGTVQIGDPSAAYSAVSVTSSWQLLTGNNATGTYGGLVNMLTAGDAIDVCCAGAFNGTLTSAQILSEGGIPLTTASAASNSGAGRYWWDFPTAGKGLVLGSPVAQMADDSWCVVCINSPTSATDKYIANIGCGASNQLISSVAISGNTGYAQAAWVDDGAAHVVTKLDAVNHFGIPTVISAVKRGGVGYLRVNGVQVGAGVSLAAMGTTTVTAGMIGGYNAANTTLQYVGAMGTPQMGKGTISDADLLTIERQVASTFPAGPTF